MRILPFVLTAVLIFAAGSVHAKNLSVDLDMRKPEVSAKEAQADEWLNKGNAAYQAKKYDEAITCYKKATELDPSFASAFYNLGVIYYAKGMTDAAISSYKQVLTIKPDYYAARNNLGIIYKKKGMIDEAMTEFKQILSKNFNFPYAHFNLAECYFTKGNMHSASEHYYKAGLFFVERGDKAWAQKSYDALKQTNAEDKVQSLLEKMNAEPKQEPAAINRVIEISPQAQ
jgi:tetratricopeptide (TPR) repeat protein